MREEKQKVRCLEIQCSDALLPAGSMGQGAWHFET
jgi:hypothetical protein